jgi:hypothetical protein
MVNISGPKETKELGKYLGVPLTGKAPKRIDFIYLIEQVKSKLAFWKAKHLKFVALSGC